jgi:hypothetical protein
VGRIRVEHQVWSFGQLARISGHEAGLLKGAALPLAVLVVAAIAGAGTDDSVLAALIASALLLVVLEVIAGHRARLSGFELGLQTLVAAGIGLGVVALKLVVH